MIDYYVNLVATHRRYEDLSSLLWSRSRKRIGEADPRIGNAPYAFLLAHNWGNPGAKAALARHDSLSSRLYARGKRECDLARHRDHVATNDFRYLWCDACGVVRGQKAVA